MLLKSIILAITICGFSFPLLGPVWVLFVRTCDRSYHPANWLTNFLGSLLGLATLSKSMQGAEGHRNEEAGAHREDATLT